MQFDRQFVDIGDGPSLISSAPFWQVLLRRISSILQPDRIEFYTLLLFIHVVRAYRFQEIFIGDDSTIFCEFLTTARHQGELLKITTCRDPQHRNLSPICTSENLLARGYKRV